MSWIIDPVIANTVALVGSCFSIAMWLAPVRDVWVGSNSVFRTSGEQIPASSLGYIAGFYNCVLWTMYYSTRGDAMMIAMLVNVAGIALNCSFTVCYWYFSQGAQRSQIKKENVFLVLVLASSIILWVVSGSNDGIGYIAMVINIIMFFGPLVALREIVHERSARRLPLPPIILQLLAAAIWTAWAIYVQEPPIIVPNSLGTIFAVVSLILWVWANHQDKLRQLAGEETNPDVEFEPIKKAKPQPTEI